MIIGTDEAYALHDLLSIPDANQPFTHRQNMERVSRFIMRFLLLPLLLLLTMQNSDSFDQWCDIEDPLLYLQVSSMSVSSLSDTLPLCRFHKAQRRLSG